MDLLWLNSMLAVMMDVFVRLSFECLSTACCTEVVAFAFIYTFINRGHATDLHITNWIFENRFVVLLFHYLFLHRYLIINVYVDFYRVHLLSCFQLSNDDRLMCHHEFQFLAPHVSIVHVHYHHLYVYAYH